MAASVWTDKQVLTQLNTGLGWGGALITYSFPNRGTQVFSTDGEDKGFISLNQSQQSVAKLALLTWDDLIKPSFKELAPGKANITFGLTDTAIEYAHAYFPTDGGIWFNKTYEELVNPTIGDYGFNAYVHEIGHALGLDHMGTYDGEAVDQPSCWQDSSVYTVMSYFGPSNNSGGEGQVAWANWTDKSGFEYCPQTPMLNDVMAIQQLYGAATTRSGNTVYGFNSNITGSLSEIYDFSKNDHPILCIYDSGGIDTINLSSYTTNSSVDLVGGDNHFSSCNGFTNNIQIARGVVIENATTGSGDDVLYGNDAANVLSSGKGKDTLYGGLGADKLTGGLGCDSMYGGVSDKASDVFIFNTTAESQKTALRDKIFDFVSGMDKIDLRGIDAASRAGDQAFEFNALAAKANSVWYKSANVDTNAATSDIIIYGDVTGDKTADFEIGLVGVSKVVAADFLL